MFKKESILTKYGPSNQTVERVSLVEKRNQNEAKPGSTEATAPDQHTGVVAAAADDDAGSRLVVGPNVKLKGAEIDDCDILVVEGRVEATMDSRVLRVADKGAFSGKVGIDIAEIRGRFDGELTARSQLVIHATGRVSGTIRYGKLLVEEGGELSGEIRALSPDSDANRDSGKSRDNTTTSGFRPLASNAG